VDKVTVTKILTTNSAVVPEADIEELKSLLKDISIHANGLPDKYRTGALRRAILDATKRARALARKDYTRVAFAHEEPFIGFMPSGGVEEVQRCGYAALLDCERTDTITKAQAVVIPIEGEGGPR